MAYLPIAVDIAVMNRRDKSDLRRHHGELIRKMRIQQKYTALIRSVTRGLEEYAPEGDIVLAREHLDEGMWVFHVGIELTENSL